MKKRQTPPPLPRTYAKLIPPREMTAKTHRIRAKKEEINPPGKRVPQQYHMCPVNGRNKEGYQ